MLFIGIILQHILTFSENLEDHPSKVKTENISHDGNVDKASNEINQDDKELPVKSNIEDSSGNRQHPEL